MQSHYAPPAHPVALLDVDARALFITRVYVHLLGAILGFTALEYVFFATGIAEAVARFMLGTSWLIILGGFMIVGWLASRAASQAVSPLAQYLALAGFVTAEALLFVPMLFIANAVAPGVITSAATVTLVGFGALTAVAFVTRKDFSFLRVLLLWGGVLAVVAILAASLFGTELGVWFSVAMIGFSGAAVLYDTSNVLHHYPEDRHVAASLQLFASIALMFWYVLRLFLSLQRD